jgi:PhnB protein
MQILPYLAFNGNCAEAFRFYEKALGGKIAMKMTYGESPMADKTAPDQRDRIMHIRLEAAGAVLMGADAPTMYAQKPQGFCISLDVPTLADAERIFNALSDGGKVNMLMAETFWAKRFGMAIDKFGQPWMVNCMKPMP